MPLDFPASPTTGATYTGPNGVVWIWDGVKWTVGTQSGAYLPLSGGTLTGDLTLKTTAGYSTLNLDSLPGTAMQIKGQRNGSVRWMLRLGSDDTETGSSAGSDFTIHRYNDAGAIAAQALSINRATGAMVLGVPLGIASGGTGQTTAAVPATWTVGSVPFATGAQTLGQDANLFWDNINKRLGVSTASPSRTLEVFGTVSGLNFELGQSQTTVAGTVGFANANGPAITMRGSGAASPGIMQLLTAGVEVVRIDQSGFVCIGSATPSYRFQINGLAATGNTLSQFRAGPNGADTTTVMISFADAAATVQFGAIARNGTNTVAYGTTSDARLKDDISDSTRGLEALLAIKVSDYRMGETAQQGLLAQQVADHYPEAVIEGGDDPALKPWMLDYGRLTPLLIKAVQELAAEVAVLKGAGK